jgi:hypothetical protein
MLITAVRAPFECASIRRMEPVPGRNESASPTPERQQAWFMRLPLWVRILVPAVLLLGGAAVVVAALQPAEPVDPVQAVRSACQSGIREEIESHDLAVVEVSFYGVDTTGDEVYLARGDAAFRVADGTVRRLGVRCTVRVEDGEMQAPSIRFSEPITAD